MDVAEYFVTDHQRKAALMPLEISSHSDVYGFRAKVYGGGKSGQADAVALGIARALIAANPDLRKQLKTAGLLTRDARVKERKKFGLKRARRAPQFSKR